MDLKLKGKLALVSGSTAGIGLAIATVLAREGARVIINGRSRASVDDVVASLKSSTGGDLHGFAGDLSVASFAEQLVLENPGVQILVPYSLSYASAFLRAGNAVSFARPQKAGKSILN